MRALPPMLKLISVILTNNFALRLQHEVPSSSKSLTKSLTELCEAELAAWAPGISDQTNFSHTLEFLQKLCIFAIIFCIPALIYRC